VYYKLLQLFVGDKRKFQAYVWLRNFKTFKPYTSFLIIAHNLLANAHAACHVEDIIEALQTISEGQQMN
jgi:hypothetical protein